MCASRRRGAGLKVRVRPGLRPRSDQKRKSAPGLAAFGFAFAGASFGAIQARSAPTARVPATMNAAVEKAAYERVSLSPSLVGIAS